LGDRLPVYEVDPQARAERVAVLHAVSPDGYYVESLVSDIRSSFYSDLPYWMNELRPTGFLGRLVPQQHPELELPGDVRIWSANQTLRYIANFGWNLTGNLIVGDAAFQHYVSLARQSQNVVSVRTRKARFPLMSEEVLRTGTPGSSAGGEQPKFLASKVPPGSSVLVKFSPAAKGALARRSADLLVAEHLAHEVLNEHGKAASKSEVIVSAGQVFLEVERFDRTLAGGRCGVLSLLALDAEFIGRARTWTDSATRLAEVAIIPPALVPEIAWLELFGRLIANTDMHLGNLSFLMSGARVLGLTPAYDMLPAQYAGQQGHLRTVAFQPPAPGPAMIGFWEPASRAAVDFWQRVATHSLISADFRRIARHNSTLVEGFRDAARLLPAAR
jgi:HipA-like C-terminal domain